MGNLLLDIGVLIIILITAWLIGLGLYHYPAYTIVFLVFFYLFYFYRSRALDEKLQPYVQKAVQRAGKLWDKRKSDNKS